MWNVHSRGHRRGLSWLLTRCSLTCDFQKGIEKIVLERKKELVSVWPNRLAGH